MGDLISPIIGMGMGILQGAMNDSRQIGQNSRLLKQQMAFDKQMAEYNQGLAYDMWQKTGPQGMIKELKAAGLNPGLMYGMGGGGGQTAHVPGGSVSGARAPVGGGELGMGIQQAMQLELLKAQKENIEADTENKKTDTLDKDATQYGKQLDNVFKEWLQGLPQAQDSNLDNSIAGNNAKIDLKFKQDENLRKELMNNKVIEEIGAKISLMAKQGLSQDEIYRNLQKEGLLLDAEIEWNKLDIEGGNVGKFLTNLIKMAIKPR